MNSHLKLESDWLKSTGDVRGNVQSKLKETKEHYSKGTGLYITNKKINIEFMFMIFYSVTITNVAYLYLPTCCCATV